MPQEIKLTNFKVEDVVLIQGEYEGYKYYKLTAKGSGGLKLSTKLTEFEYNQIRELYAE